MSTIKIGSVRNKKGMEVHPFETKFDGLNVEQIVRNEEIIWQKPQPLVPILSGYTWDGGKISQSSTNSTHYSWKCFDGDPSTVWNANAANGWIRVEFTEKKTVFRIECTPQTFGNFAIDSFAIQGSNDINFNTYETLGEAVVTELGEKFIFTINQYEPYQYYRIQCKNNDKYTCMGEVQLYGY